MTVLVAALAAAALGLWWGERGRRIAAERWAVQGTPDHPVAKSYHTVPEPETRIAEAVSEETMERGTKALLDLARGEGVSMTEEQARDHVAFMLEGEVPPM